MSASAVKRELETLGRPEKARHYAGFFKTGPGEYGEGDVFIGVTVPEQRRIAREYSRLSLDEVDLLLHDRIHECRFTALLILIRKFELAGADEKKTIFDFYLSRTKYVNNWDLVDLSAPKIVGAYLLRNPGQRSILYSMSKSSDLWERRISIMGTFPMIKNGRFEDALKIAAELLSDEHDLIHKAVGWMLREVGKVDLIEEEVFLIQYYKTMPRTMLRYAVEKFEPRKRKLYLKRD
ncbi:MAG: DNA alkylation repair protein [Deltaproteobacteria bacterium]|nr:DNA alkylation repair protein [Deltaproteobacteria bacterium]MBF0526432.1 DNA alkylation repair protein [Deltaproteobacteria bacterium]